LDIGSKLKLVELLEVASTYVLALDFTLSWVCTGGGVVTISIVGLLLAAASAYDLAWGLA